MLYSVDNYIGKFGRIGWPLSVVRAVKDGTPIAVAILAYHLNGR